MNRKRDVNELELKEKLIEIEERRNAGVKDISAREVSKELRDRLEKGYRDK